MKTKLTLRKQALIPLSIFGICVPLYGWAMVWFIDQGQTQLRQERHAREVISQLDKLSLAQQNLTFDLLKSIVIPNQPGSEQFRRYTSIVRSNLEALKRLVASEPQYVPKVKELDSIMSESISVMEECRDKFVRQQAPLLTTMRYERRLNALARHAAAASTEILEAYRGMQEAGSEEQTKLSTRVVWLLVAGLFLIVLSAVTAALLFNFGIVRRLQALERNSVKLAVDAPLEPPVGGDDEIASVDAAFHTMAQTLAHLRKKERAVVDNALDLICSIDGSYRFTALNPASEALLGYKPDELMGRRCFDIVSDLLRADARSALTAAIEQQGDCHLETSLLRKDRAEITVLWNAHWSEEERALFCVIRDISARKEIERMKEEFISMVSHDVRTPITSVHAMLTLVAEGLVDTSTDDGKRRILEAQAAAERVMDLVTELLDLDRMQSGRLVLDLVEVNLSTVVRKSLDTIKVFADQRNVQLLNSTTEAIFLADEGRLAQVLTNLIANAIKFSPSGGTVTVSSETALGICAVKVRDEGPGVPAESQQAIFERFKQLPTAHTQSGSGLGLAICKAIVESHNGTVGVDSEEGKGSTFWFKIPLAASGSPEGNLAAERSPAQA